MERAGSGDPRTTGPARRAELFGSIRVSERRGHMWASLSRDSHGHDMRATVQPIF